MAQHDLTTVAHGPDLPGHAALSSGKGGLVLTHGLPSGPQAWQQLEVGALAITPKTPAPPGLVAVCPAEAWLINCRRTAGPRSRLRQCRLVVRGDGPQAETCVFVDPDDAQLAWLGSGRVALLTLGCLRVYAWRAAGALKAALSVVAELAVEDDEGHARPKLAGCPGRLAIARPVADAPGQWRVAFLDALLRGTGEATVLAIGEPALCFDDKDQLVVVDTRSAQWLAVAMDEGGAARVERVREARAPMAARVLGAACFGGSLFRLAQRAFGPDAPRRLEELAQL